MKFLDVIPRLSSESSRMKYWGNDNHAFIAMPDVEVLKKQVIFFSAKMFQCINLFKTSVLVFFFF